MAERILDVNQLREILDYNPETGVFVWKRMLAHRRKSGSVAGSKTHGYVEIGVWNRSYRAHHLAWLYVYGEWPKGVIDHIDGDRSNNAISNLREATNQQNAQNRHWASSSKESSSLLGITWNKRSKCWMAQIKHPNGNNVNLGLYDSEQDAYAAYLHAKRELHPESNLSAAALPPKPTRRPNTRGTSGVRGVSFERSRNKWCVRVAREGKYKHLGYFDTEQEAAQKLKTFNETSRTSSMQGIETPETADNLPQGIEQ